MSLAATASAHALRRSRAFWTCVGAVGLALAGTTASAQEAPRDTVVVLRRDTVVVVQRDTLVLVEPSAEQEREPTPEERRRRRQEEYAAWLAEQPVRRVPGTSRAVKAYPTRLLDLDFPSLLVGYELAYDGRFAFEGQFGPVISPWLATNPDFGGDGSGRARFGLRGIRLGVEGRYYTSRPHVRFPMYVGAGLEYALAPVLIGMWLPSASGGFERYREVPANGQLFGSSLLLGWELRTPEGLVVDLGTGIRFGAKGLYSASERVQEELFDQRPWLGQQGTVPYFGFVLRVGLGFGDWEPVRSAKGKSGKAASSRGKSGQRRRGKRRR